MTDTPEAVFDDLARAAESRRKKQFAWTAASIAIPALAGLAVLSVSYGAVSEARTELGDLRQQAESARAELETARNRKAELEGEISELREEQSALALRAARAEESLAETQDALRESTRFTKSIFNLDWGDMKELASQFEGAHRAILRMADDRERDLPFSLTNDPEIGFSSPGYAAHLLVEFGVVSDRGSPSDTLRQLDAVPALGGSPNVGDIVVYETGYHLFYYRVQNGEFVAGMTPSGIAAIDYRSFDLAKRAILRVPRR